MAGVSSAVQGVGAPRRYDHDDEVLQRRRCDTPCTVFRWDGREVCDVTDENPALLVLAATTPVGVVPLLGGVAEVCRHHPTHFGCCLLAKALVRCRTGDGGVSASLLCWEHRVWRQGLEVLCSGSPVLVVGPS